MLLTHVNAPPNAAEQFKTVEAVPRVYYSTSALKVLFTKTTWLVKIEHITSSGAQALSPSSTFSCSYPQVAAREYLRTPIP